MEMTMSSILRRAAPHVALGVGFATAPLADGWQRLLLWRALARERRALARLEARLLRDIGLDEAAVEAEAARPFWDAPAGR
jgi:uncharacterized protein YjiS (DUF1127 family)